MRRQLLPALVTLLCLTVLVGLAYPLVVTGIAQGAFGHRANGSLVSVDGRVVGSELIGQGFTDPKYFWPRPSAAGDGYDPQASGASNLGPSNDQLIGQCTPTPVKDETGAAVTDTDGDPVYEVDAQGQPVCNPDSVPQRAAAYREANGLAADAPVPVDAVTSSGSGLDPHISVANARLQAPRVARERGLPLDQVQALIDDATEQAPLGVLGADGVNVLRLDLALDGVTTTG